jgi:ABC-type glycerol-3-phosphate transport system substrate-binding protein
MKLWGERLQITDLEVWISWEGTRLLKEEMKRFERLHGLGIKVVEVPRTQSKLLAVLRARGKLPDLVMIQSDYVPALKKARALQNLDYMNADDIVEKGLRAFRADGKLWAMPFYFDSQIVFYNPNHLRPQDLPPGFPLNWSLGDLEAMAETLKSRGQIPMAWNAYSAYWLVPFQVGFGKDPLIDSDGSMRIDDSATQRAIEYILDLKNRDLMRAMERDAMISLFTSGSVGLILSGSYSIPLFREIGIDYDVAAYPHNHGKPLAPLLDFKGFAITRKSRNPILARRLIQYLTGIGVQRRFTNALSKLPANRSVWSLMEQDHTYVNVLEKSYETGIPVPAEKAYGTFKNTMWKLLRLVLSGQMSVREVLAQGQKILNANRG